MNNIVKTGIPGFDEMLGGGFPLNKCILLSGTPGTGKTIFSLQYLYNGAKDFGEKGLYVSFEETTSNLKAQAKSLGWDLDQYEKDGLIEILNIPVHELKIITTVELLSYIRANNIKRVVIDSLSALAINVPTNHIEVTKITDFYVQKFIYNFINSLKALENSTSLVISQTVDDQLSRDGVSEFVADGVIIIKYDAIGGSYSRHLAIRKMREVKNDEEMHPLEISPNGIIIHTYGE